MHPSDRHYLRLVNAYARKLNEWVMSALRRAEQRRVDAADDGEWTEAEAIVAGNYLVEELIVRPPPPAPGPDAVEQANAPAERQAARQARRALVRGGAPPSVVASRLGVPAGSELTGIRPELSAGEVNLIRQWSVEGASWLQGVPLQLQADLPAVIREAVQEGSSWKSVAKLLERRSEVAKSHLEFIARDQIGTLNFRITQETQSRAGVDSYRWSTSGDSRVRPTHRAADGQVFRWDGVGAPGAGWYGGPAHPGEGPGCRCVAIPVVEL